MAKTIPRRILIVLISIPIFVQPFVVIRYGVNLHLVDEWAPDMAGLFIKAHQHQLTLADVFSQHMEHRLVIARLIFFWLADLTHWNNFANMFAGWIIAAATAIGILCLIWQTSTNPADPDPNSAARWRRFLLRGFLCNLILFTPTQAQDWLWGIGMANYLPMAILLPTLMIARSSLPFGRRLILCMLLASAASYTNANGFIAWPLAGLMLAWSYSLGEFKKKLPGLLIGFALCVAIIASYFYHYSKPSLGNAVIAPLTIGGMLRFVLEFAGNPFANISAASRETIAVAAGSILLGLYLAASAYVAFAWRRKQHDFCHRTLVWIALGAFALLSGAMAAPSRSTTGIGAGAGSRYVTYSVYLCVALINLVPIILRDLTQTSTRGLRKAPAVFSSLLSLVLCAAVLLTYPASLFASRQWRGAAREMKAVLLLINVLPNTPNLLEFSMSPPKDFVAFADALDDLGYLQPPLIYSPDASHLRKPDPDHTRSRGMIESARQVGADTLALEGWAISPQNHAAADAVFLTYDDENHHPIIFFQGRIGKPRSDIARRFDDSRYLPSGWTATFPLAALPAAPRAMRITAWVLNVDDATAVPLDRAFTLSR